MMIVRDELLFLATLGSTRGIKGEMRFQSEDDLSPLKGEKIILERDCLTLYEVEDVGRETIKLKGVDIHLAESLVNYKIFLAKRDISIFKEILSSELLGLEVYFKGKVIGRVSGVARTALYKILIVEGKRSYSIPMIEEFVEYKRGGRLILKVPKERF